MTIISYNYEDTNKNLTNIPTDTHLIIQKDSNTLYFVKSGDKTKLYKYVFSTSTESQVDIDPSNTSGDGKSRDKDIQSLWYDGTYIWGVDCDNDDVDVDFDVWKLQVSDDTCTEIGTSTAATHLMNVYDIYKKDAGVYVACLVYNEPGNGYEFITYEVSSAPFSEEGTYDLPG